MRSISRLLGREGRPELEVDHVFRRAFQPSLVFVGREDHRHARVERRHGAVAVGRHGAIDRPPGVAVSAEARPREDRPVLHPEPGAGHRAALAVRLGERRHRNEAAIARVGHHAAPHRIGQVGDQVHRFVVKQLAASVLLRPREAPFRFQHDALAGGAADDDAALPALGLGRNVQLSRIGDAEVAGHVRHAWRHKVEIAHRSPPMPPTKRLVLAAVRSDARPISCRMASARSRLPPGPAPRRAAPPCPSTPAARRWASRGATPR